MKQVRFLIFIAVGLFATCASFENDNAKPKNRSSNIENPTRENMKINVGKSTFTSTLYDNATATAFKALLPMTAQMVELNGNEKYVDLPRSLLTSPANPKTIQAGDLMLYGSSTLVLFYKTFSTSYSYTRLGRIDDVSGLAEAVGSGNMTVTY